MEKRQRQRKKTHLAVRFGAERPDRIGMITDVSSRGLYISTNSVLPRGTALQLRIPLPGGEPVLLDGMVARSRRVAPILMSVAIGGMGVRLKNTPAVWRTSLALPEEC